MTYNPKIKNTAANKVTIDADINATNINLGAAEDNDDPTNIQEDPTYQDGLFAFDTQTTVGVAIDRINEVLAKIAPAPAPALDALSSDLSSGQSQYLAILDSSDAAYANQVEELKRYTGDSRTLGEINGNKGLFEKIQDGSVGGTKYRRLGVLSTKQSITLTLNGNIPTDTQGSETNYPNFAYNTTDTKDITPPITVFFNGTNITSNVAVDNIIVNEPATFASGETFDGFVHSVTTVTLPVALTWLEGHNHVYVVYNDSKQTSYLDWVYAPSEYTGDYSFPDPSISNLSVTESAAFRYNSGFKYYTGASNFVIKPPANSSIGNYAIQSFPSDFGISISGTGIESKSATILSSFLDIGNVDINAKTIAIANLQTNLANNARFLNSVIPMTINVNNQLGRNGSVELKTADTYMFDSNPESDGAIDYASSGKVLDTFNHENHRVSQSEADNFAPSTTKPATWNSQELLGDGDALVYNGRLYHPKYIGNTLSSLLKPPQSGQSFDNFSQPAVYYRVFRKTDGSNNNITFKIKYNNVVFGTTSETTKCRVEIQRQDGQWIDACAPTSAGGAAQTNPLTSAPPSSPSGYEFQLSWVSGTGPVLNNYWLMKIILPTPASPGLESYIDQLDLVSSS